MPAGRHDHYAAIQTATSSNDAGGNAVYTWSTAANRWAMVQDKGGGELYRAQKIDATVDAVITLREQYVGLSPQDRIVIGSRTFEIKSVLAKSDRETRFGQVVYCKEVVS